MDYSEARRLVESLPSQVKPGLDRIVRLLAALDHPEGKFPAVHIAGTNGKGSVVAMLASVLQSAGYRVGRFTSPDLLDFRDRITVDGKWIPKEDFAVIVERLRPLLAGSGDLPTMFEVLTAIAFSHFATKRVDIGVIEVGLGGRYDATNVVRPAISILTNVGRDHLNILGEKIERVAWEKAGIAKSGIPLIVGKLSPETDRVVRSVARNVGAPIVCADAVHVDEAHRDLDRALYRVSGPGLPDEIAIPLIGGYEKENLRASLAAIAQLRKTGWKIPNSAVQTGLENVRWPGRFEVINRTPLVILDGAHNLPGAIALTADIKRFLPKKAHRQLLFGILADKEVEPVCAEIFPLFSRVVLTQSESPRALPAVNLSPIAAKYGIGPQVTESVKEGVEAAQDALSNDDALLVTGSLTVIREARPLFLGAR